MKAVTGIFIYGDRLAETETEFYAISHEYEHANPYPPPMGNIQSLEDLRLFTSLRKLCVVSHPITDLTPLMSCVWLNIVHLNNCAVTDISPLASLPQLESLHCKDALINDFSFIGGMKMLWSLSFHGVPLYTLEEMGDISHIQQLIINGAPLNSLEGIEKVVGLAELSVESTKVSDFSPLNDLPYLERLYISGDMERYLHTLNNDRISVTVN